MKGMRSVRRGEAVTALAGWQIPEPSGGAQWFFHIVSVVSLLVSLWSARRRWPSGDSGGHPGRKALRLLKILLMLPFDIISGYLAIHLLVFLCVEPKNLYSTLLWLSRRGTWLPRFWLKRGPVAKARRLADVITRWHRNRYRLGRRTLEVVRVLREAYIELTTAEGIFAEIDGGQRADVQTPEWIAWIVRAKSDEDQRRTAYSLTAQQIVDLERIVKRLLDRCYISCIRAKKAAGKDAEAVRNATRLLHGARLRLQRLWAIPGS